MDKVQFFKSVYGSGKGRAVIVLPNYSGKPTNDHWFSYPEQVQEMADFAEANKNKDVWYSPVLYESDSRSKAKGNVLSIAGADADECDPQYFRVRPTIEIETSPGRWHVYWQLDKPYDANEVAKLNRRIAQVHKHQGCDVAFVNAAKLLRVPETSNMKHPGAVVIVSDYDVHTYTLTELEEIYPATEIPDVTETGEGRAIPDGLEEYVADNRHKLTNNLPNSIGLRELLYGKYHEDRRSEVLWKLVNELLTMGLSDEDITAVAWGAPTNKFNGEDRRGLKGLWDTVVKARAQMEAQEMDEWDNPIGFGEDKVKPKITEETPKLTNFLTEEEQQIIREHTNFIDEWIQWASEKTDSPIEYHRAAAITLLSAVFSEFGHATPKFGKLKLNIWMMILGRSTKDRKTTSRGYMNRAFRQLKTDDYNYSLGDDVTPSGLSLALHDRANKSSVFDRDEVQGLFKELLGQSYMAGGIEVFTKLYDGWSGGRIRATGDKKVLESVPVSFIMFMMGILEEATDVLTVTNYKSGFLTRFVYVIGKRPENYEEPEVEQSDEEDEDDDPVFNGLINHLILNRSYWEFRIPEPGKTIPLRAEEDAWTRHKLFRKDVERLAGESKYAEIIGTTSERLTWTTLKLAALLAMDDRSATIKLPHMLQAIAYAGEWFDNSVEVASLVNESEWLREVNKVEQFIAAKTKVSKDTVYRNFPMKPREFQEIIDALIERGSIKQTPVGSRWVLEVNYDE